MLFSAKKINENAEKNYLQDFPKRTSDDLKYEIGKIAELLLDNKPCNRYTETVRKKANKDKKIQEFKVIKDTEIKIIDYDNKKMKAQILFKNLSKDYKLNLDMDAVSRGRLFLNGYTTEKEKYEFKKKFYK